MKRHQSRGSSRVFALATLLVTSPGCSFLFVRTAPSPDGGIVSRSQPGECTSSRLAPGFDTGIGAFQLVRTGMAVAADDSVYDDPDQLLSREADIAIGASLAALFVGSAVYGFVHTGRCSALRAATDEPAPDESKEKWNGTNARPEAAPATPAAPAASAPVEALPTPAPADAAPPPAPEEPPANDSVPSAPSR
jgi:hypothetical protein